MGGGQSKEEALAIPYDQWLSVRKQGNLEIFRNKTTNQQAQMHVVEGDPRHTKDSEMEIYMYRKTQDEALVQVYAAESINSANHTTCGNQRSYKVLTERIPNRISAYNSMPLDQNLYALCQSLRGFSQCYAQIGSFQVTSDMIGVNQDGLIKVWVNQQLGSNHTTTEKPVLQILQTSQSHLTQEETEETMVRNIIKIMEKQYEGQKYPQELRWKLNGKKNFDEAYHSIQAYSTKQNIIIPDRLTTKDSIIQNNSELEDKMYSSQNRSSIKPLQLHSTIDNRLSVQMQNKLYNQSVLAQQNQLTSPINNDRPSLMSFQPQYERASIQQFQVENKNVYDRGPSLQLQSNLMVQFQSFTAHQYSSIISDPIQSTVSNQFQSNHNVPQSNRSVPQSNQIIAQSNRNVPQSNQIIAQSNQIITQSNRNVPQSNQIIPQSSLNSKFQSNQVINQGQGSQRNLETRAMQANLRTSSPIIEGNMYLGATGQESAPKYHEYQNNLMSFPSKGQFDGGSDIIQTGKFIPYNHEMDAYGRG